MILMVYSYFHNSIIWKTVGSTHNGSKRQQIDLLLLFPSAVLTASGSKGISQHKGTPKVFCKAISFYFEMQTTTDKNTFIGAYRCLFYLSKIHVIQIMNEKEYLQFCKQQVSGELSEDDLITMLSAWGAINYSLGYKTALSDNNIEEKDQSKGLADPLN